VEQLHPELESCQTGPKNPLGMKEENYRISISKEFISCSSLWLIRICHRKTKGKIPFPLVPYAQAQGTMTNNSYVRFAEKPG